jgi:cytochrome c556
MASPKKLTTKGLVALTIALLLAALLLNACGDNPQTQQQATQSRKSFEQELAHARMIGTPESQLQSIIKQAQQLNQTSAPLTLFSSEPTTTYYANMSQRYTMLKIQLRGLEMQVTQQLDFQANTDLQNFATVLSQRQAQGFVAAKNFANQLTQDQDLMAQAQYPKHYMQISTDAKSATQALRLMGPTYDVLNSFQALIQQMEASKIDVTALKQQEQYDVEQFRKANSPNDFMNLTDQINSQFQTSTALSTQAIPYVGASKLKQFSADIDQMKLYGQDTRTYQQQLNADQAALNKATTLRDFLKISSQIDSHMNAIQIPLLQGRANYLLQQFHQEVNNWGSTHQYHDAYDGQSYRLDYEYDQQGIGSDLDYVVQTAETKDDYQAAIDTINNNMQHLKAMEADYSDTTPWNQPHASDTQLMQHYNLNSGQVIVVSLIEQSLRLYQDGKLVRSFLITSGQYEKPTPPGYWHIFLRQSPTKFKSSEPKGSAFWYPDTNINYAMEYRDGGYFIHDSWWRVDYGPKTNFPHVDSGGDQSFAGSGSHGCINMQEEQAAWMYAHTGYGTPVIIY